MPLPAEFVMVDPSILKTTLEVEAVKAIEQRYHVELERYPELFVTYCSTVVSACLVAMPFHALGGSSTPM